MTVCILDTSVLVELLGLPGFRDEHEQRLADFKGRATANERFLLPLPVLFETGNHVAQLIDGGRRRDWAERFSALEKPALLGKSPFVLTPSPGIEDVASWLEDFPDHAMRKIGLVDRSLIALFTQETARVRGTRAVYIWSLDQALAGYDTRDP